MIQPQKEGHFIRLPPVWLVFLSLFLLLGTIYTFRPQCANRVQSFFPLFGRAADRLDEAAELLKDGIPISDAVQAVFHRGGENAETNPF